MGSPGRTGRRRTKRWCSTKRGRSGDFADFEPIEYSGSLRVAFFFHYLDLSRPLETPLGDVALPDPSPAPERLSFMEYEAP